MPPRLRGKWALGITPRNFTWILKDKLAVCERPGGYGDNHRRVRLQKRKELCLGTGVRAHHSVCVDRSFRFAGRAGGKQNFCRSVHIDSLESGIHLRPCDRQQQVGKRHGIEPV